jgi:uncharacterized protein (DUF427 family)
MGALRFEPTSARVRADLGGEVVVDSRFAVLVWEPRRLIPVYAVPATDVRGRLELAETVRHVGEDIPRLLGPEDFGLHTTPGTAHDLVTGSRRLAAAAFAPDDPDLAGLVLLDFDAFDAWWAEEERLIGHAHDPFKRIDVLASRRRIEVRLDGVTLADSSRPKMLLETHLPPRWYLPPEDVRTDLLEPGTSTTVCAYKGVATYSSLVGGGEAGRDLAWRYRHPLHDALQVKGRLCFWSERTDLLVDGELVPRPVTPWSPPEVQRAADPDRLEFG